MKDLILQLFENSNIDQVGFVSANPTRDLLSLLEERQNYRTTFQEQDLDKRTTPRNLMSDAQSIIVALFPYYSGPHPNRNLSLYCLSKDYHLVAKEIMDDIGDKIKCTYPDFRYKTFVDNGPLVDRDLAYRGGLGFFGVNSHLINPKYGTYTFIGYMLTNQQIPPSTALNASCYGCQKCVKACPGQAIYSDGTINGHRCRSYLTQKKGELTKTELNIIKRTPLLFGCDVCQEVCPHNKDVPMTPVQGLSNDLLTHLSCEELTQITNKQFKALYGHRAFSWRGKKILIRNQDIIKGDTTDEQ